MLLESLAAVLGVPLRHLPIAVQSSVTHVLPVACQILRLLRGDVGPDLVGFLGDEAWLQGAWHHLLGLPAVVGTHLGLHYIFSSQASLWPRHHFLLIIDPLEFLGLLRVHSPHL